MLHRIYVKEKFYDYMKNPRTKELVEVLINPKWYEIRKIPTWKQSETVRGALDINTDELFVWDFKTLHYEVLDSIDPEGKRYFLTLGIQPLTVSITASGYKFGYDEAKEILDKSKSIKELFPEGYEILTFEGSE